MKITPSVKKYVALFDCHFGWEKRHVGREYKTFTTHNPAAIAAALEFTKEFKPDTVILGGDQVNFAPISHWNTDKHWANEKGRIKLEMDECEKQLLHPLLLPATGVSEWVWMTGNHEQWLYDFIQKNPAIQGMVEPENYLKDSLCRFKFIEQGGVFWLGKLGFIHGDTLGKGGSPALTASRRYQNNMRLGHYHTYNAHTQYNLVDAKDIKTIVVVPALASINQSYAKGAPSMCLNGFNYGYVWPDGRYTDYTVVMADSKFIGPTGKLFDGKELLRKNK